MPQAAQFPLYLPPGAVRPFATDEVTRRLTQVAQLSEGSRLLEVGGTEAVLRLVSRMAASLVVAELDGEAVACSRERAQAAGLTERVEVRKVELDRLPFRDGEFQAALLLGGVPMPFELALKRLRRVLLPSEGRLVLTYPVRVGRSLTSELQDFWRNRLGEPLRPPRELFMAMERAGFESEDGLTFDAEQLEQVYASSAPLLQGQSGLAADLLREEVALHRSPGGRGAVTYALLVGRRREPGERPFTSRDRG